MNKDKYILKIYKKEYPDNKFKYALFKNEYCIAEGIATHDNIIKLFYERYPCIIKYVEKH